MASIHGGRCQEAWQPPEGHQDHAVGQLFLMNAVQAWGFLVSDMLVSAGHWFVESTDWTKNKKS